MGIGPLLLKEFSKWPLNSKWPPCFLKDVIVDLIFEYYSSDWVEILHGDSLRPKNFLSCRNYLVENGTSGVGRIFNVAAQI